MSETKHTPGPWFYDPGDSGDASVGLSGYAPFVYAEAPNGEPIEICRLSDPLYRVDPDPADEFDEGLRWLGDVAANGRLLKAAPRLLKAAEYLLAKVGDDYRTDCGRAFKDLEDAVAAAKGDAP